MRIEANIDALVGPTHHYGGIGVGNVASLSHANQASRPRDAALEGLAKAEQVSGLGIPQFIWLPPRRPRLDFLTQLGFEGLEQTSAGRAVDPAAMRNGLQHAFEVAPRALSAAFSSAFMWAANSGTFTPDVDARDGNNHFTPANLVSSWHRASEAEERWSDARALWGPASAEGSVDSVVHAPLPASVPLRDEGAANHMRLSGDSGMAGLHVFVHGWDEDTADSTSSFFPRHTRAASEVLSRLHKLDDRDTFFLQQHPAAISAGVFHNDVIATSHRNLLLHHQFAFGESEETHGSLARLEERFRERCGQELIRICITEDDFSLEEAVQSYFFNSQLLTPGSSSPVTSSLGPAVSRMDGSDRPMIMLCPAQCERIAPVKLTIDRLIAAPNNPICRVIFVSLDQSMANGGGPACLRLRVPLDTTRLAIMGREVQGNCLVANAANLDRIRQAVEGYYPEELTLAGLTEPAVVEAAEEAWRELQRLSTTVL
ncbi:MAG: N-succinylarginine dihydrolase [Pirellulaceae bacterium]